MDAQKATQSRRYLAGPALACSAPTAAPHRVFLLLQRLYPFGPPDNANGSEDERTAKKPEPVYGSPEEFLHEQLLPTYVRTKKPPDGWFRDAQA